MQYLLLIYMDDKAYEALPEAEKEKIMNDSGAWSEELKKSGKGTLAAGLHPASTATTVRTKDNKLTTIDGPFAETREVLGGFQIIDVKDLDEALAIAKRFPGIRTGAIEVRAIAAVV